MKTVNLLNMNSGWRQRLQPVVEMAVSTMNARRLRSPVKLDYIQFMLPSSMPPLPEHRNLIQQRIFGPSPLSLVELEQAFRRIADDPRPKGVILHLRGFSMSLADLQTLRNAMLRLKNRGKRIVCYAQGYDMATYYVASAADEILLQPGGALATTGLVQQQTFLRDALDTLGLQADSVAISPYKQAADILTRNTPSPEAEAMTNWLLDSRYAMLIEDIGQGRNLSAFDVRRMIDNAPYTDKQAREAGYVDALVTEEGLYAHLGTKDIVLWEQADGVLPLRIPRYTGKYVVVLRLGGMIVPGESAAPPVDIPIPIIGGERLGDLTIVRQVRNIMQDDSAAAVVLFIDSPGGSSTASEAIASALDELAKTRPVVACMNAVAGSGGYYIATPADWMVARPGTITGSIGVFALKLVNNEALRKLRFNPITYLRGENAGIFAPVEPFTAAQRQKMQAQIESVYDRFIGRVADARKMKPDQVDTVGGGRVWTGKQALQNGLVDETGGLYEALKKARSMANLREDTPIAVYESRGKPLPAQLAEQLNPAAALRYWQQNLIDLTNGSALMLMPFEWRF